MNQPEFLRNVLAEISMASPWALLLTKATLLLAVAWIIYFSLARANPRWRTLLWRGAVVGLLLMAVWTLGLPSLEIRIQAPKPVAIALRSPLEPVVAEHEPAMPVISPVHSIQGPASVEMTATTHQASAAVRPEAARSVESSRPSLWWRTALLGIWGFGVGLLVVRTAIAYIRLTGLLQASQVASEEIIAEVERIAATLGCRRVVQVRSLRREKGTGPICRHGPEGAAHKLDLSPFPAADSALAPRDGILRRWQFGGPPPKSLPARPARLVVNQ